MKFHGHSIIIDLGIRINVQSIDGHYNNYASKYETLARGARQLVVQLAFETILMPGSYVFSFTPITNIGASADGADITTFFAPPY